MDNLSPQQCPECQRRLPNSQFHVTDWREMELLRSRHNAIDTEAARVTVVYHYVRDVYLYCDHCGLAVHATQERGRPSFSTQETKYNFRDVAAIQRKIPGLRKGRTLRTVEAA